MSDIKWLLCTSSTSTTTNYYLLSLLKSDTSQKCREGSSFCTGGWCLTGYKIERGMSGLRIKEGVSARPTTYSPRLTMSDKSQMSCSCNNGRRPLAISWEETRLVYLCIYLYISVYICIYLCISNINVYVCAYLFICMSDKRQKCTQQLQWTTSTSHLLKRNSLCISQDVGEMGIENLHKLKEKPASNNHIFKKFLWKRSKLSRTMVNWRGLI